ncbi:alpha/beta hydrolase [soil metagenome]
MNRLLHAFADRLESRVLATVMALPPMVQRLLAGRPVVRDGLTLDTEPPLILRLQRLPCDPGLSGWPMAHLRRDTRRSTRLAGGRQPIGATRDLELPGGAGAVPARLYTPRGRVGSTEPAPLLVFIHGGGMVFGDLETHDPTCRLFAERADALVLAVDYRLAPEHPFPAAVDDCWASLQWVAENAEVLGVDPSRIAVGGDSAGGTLSAVMAIKAAEAGIALRFQLLLYPATNMAAESESRRLFGDGFLLTQDFVELAHTAYVTGDHELTDPLVSVQYTEKFPAGLAPALVVTAGFDPRRDEGEAYARTLSEAGVQVELKRYDGFVHGFVNVVGIGRSQRAAVAEIAAKVKLALH